MKRRWTITLIVIVCLAAIVPVCKYWPRTIDNEECSDLYRSYLHTDGIRATYIKGKKLNDTVRVDLTLLQATDAKGCAQLEKDFGIPAPDPETSALLNDDNPDIILSLIRNEDSIPNFQFSIFNSDVAAASRTLQCISIFHITTEEQFNIIVENHIDQLLK